MVLVVAVAEVLNTTLQNWQPFTSRSVPTNEYQCRFRKTSNRLGNGNPPRSENAQN
jgi:hypothetical protein